MNLLKDQSKIFRSEQLSKYQARVNAAAFELCQKDGSLLMNKVKLFELSRKKVNEEGYAYAKKESRSKYYGVHSAARPKRKYTAENIRLSRIDDIRESISSLKETIQLLCQQKKQYVSNERFLQAADVNTTILEKNKKKRELERKLEQLEKAEGRSKDYHKKRLKKVKAESKPGKNTATSSISKPGESIEILDMSSSGSGD